MTPLLKRVVTLTAAFTGLLLAGSLYYHSPKISLSILGGGVMALANFVLLCRAVAALLGAEPASKGRLVALFFLKFAMLALVFVVIWKLPIDIIAFVVGLSTVVIATTVAGLWPKASQ